MAQRSLTYESQHRTGANADMCYRSWQANKLNEQSELRRAFQLALVLADSEPRITVKVAIKGKLERGWRRYTFGYPKDRSNTVQIELCSRTTELASIIETLGADIARLNTLDIPEHTGPAGTTSVGDDSITNNSNNNQDNDSEVTPQQPLEI